MSTTVGYLEAVILPPRDRRIPDLVSLREAAEILGVSRQFVHKLAAKGDLPGARVGEAWVFRRTVVKQHATKAGKANPRRHALDMN